MTVTLIGMDTAKSIFQIHGVDAAGRPQLKRKLRREEVIPFFEPWIAATASSLNASGKDCRCLLLSAINTS